MKERIQPQYDPKRTARKTAPSNHVQKGVKITEICRVLHIVQSAVHECMHLLRVCVWDWCRLKGLDRKSTWASWNYQSLMKEPPVFKSHWTKWRALRWENLWRQILPCRYRNRKATWQLLCGACSRDYGNKECFERARRVQFVSFPFSSWICLFLKSFEDSIPH